MSDRPTPALNGIGLALHTSSPDFGLALGTAQNGRLDDVRHQSWPLGRDLSSQLHQHLAEFLAPQTWADLCFLAVATGPGGFTGTRLGVVTARTLAQQLEIPLFGVSSLAAIAHQIYRTKPTNSDVALALPAQRGQLHTALFSWQDNTLLTKRADAVCSPDEWAQILAAYPDAYRQHQVDGGLGHTAPDLLYLALHRWHQGDRGAWEAVTPYYGQHPVPQ